MVYEQVIFHVGPDTSAAFESTFAQRGDLLTGAPGCRSAELLRSVETAGQYVLRVAWDSVEDHTERYVGTAPHQELSEVLGSFITAMVSTDHLDARPIGTP